MIELDDTLAAHQVRLEPLAWSGGTLPPPGLTLFMEEQEHPAARDEGRDAGASDAASLHGTPPGEERLPHEPQGRDRLPTAEEREQLRLEAGEQDRLETEVLADYRPDFDPQHALQALRAIQPSGSHFSPAVLLRALRNLGVPANIAAAVGKAALREALASGDRGGLFAGTVYRVLMEFSAGTLFR